MALTKIPDRSTLSDGQFIQVEGPNNIASGFVYDQQQNALYAKESQILFPSKHGSSHVFEDPIPDATCDSPGLMSEDDKCKLDAMSQTRLGVLGFQGAGFPNDGGWLQGDVILAAGTEFIQLERVANVIRFTVDSPIPLNCACFRDGARVLMYNGTTKAIEDVKVGDLVITHKGRVKPVVKLFRNSHDGLVYNWKVDKHSGEGFAVTGNHPIRALERAHAFFPSGRVRKAIKERPRWIDAGELRAGDLVVRRRSHNSVADIQTIDILAELGDGFVERGGLVYALCADGFVDGMAYGIPRYLSINDDLLDFVGYYAAEGCASRKNGIRLSIHRDELAFGDIGAEIIRLLPTIFGLEASLHDRAPANACDIQVFSVPLAELLIKWFGKKRQKHFPDWVMALPAAKQQRIVAALIRGDGYITHQHSSRYFTLGLCARALIDQTLFMAERCGWEPANPAPIVSRNKIRYRLSITDSNAPDLCRLLGVACRAKKLSRERRAGKEVMRRVAEWSQEHFCGTVNNFEVADDNSYIVDGVVVHNCEECNQIFWVQDETDIAAIRPPTCSGKLPGANVYGEFKNFLFPEATIVDPANPSTTLNNKGNYPALTFTRYKNSVTPGKGEIQVVLVRNASNSAQTQVGFAFTPGQDGGRVECLFYTGLDNDGNQTTFRLDPNLEPGLLGSILYKGHLITKQMAVVVDYTANTLTANQYSCRLWDVQGAEPVGDAFTATNVWRYTNPENDNMSVDPKALVLDSTVDVLPAGTLIDIWSFQVAEINGSPILRYYFNKKPTFNAANAWTMLGGVQFGDLETARGETEPGPGSEDKTLSISVSEVDDFEPTIWGLTGFDDPVFVFDDVEAEGTEGTRLDVQHRAIIDTALPGLRILRSEDPTEPFSERPVVLWHRIATATSQLVRLDLGRPDETLFTPYDILLNAPIDHFDGAFMKVVGTGVVSGLNYIAVIGVNFKDIPQSGTVRIISQDGNRNSIWRYGRKMLFPASNEHWLILTGVADDDMPYPGNTGDVVELLHREFNAPCVRVQFTNEESSGEVSIQVKVGLLDMGLPYEGDVADDIDDFVRGLRPGYAVSSVYTQVASWSGVGPQPDSNFENFKIYDGGTGTDSVEYWNTVEVMLRGDQVWVWWNGLLVPPNSTLSQSLPTPVTVTTPYFPAPDSLATYGKFGLRMWPGSKIRRAEMRTQIRSFSELNYGQLELQ